MYVFGFITVAGTVSDIPDPDSGSTVVIWSPPVPPNGDILYYNVRISNADTGELILLVIELYDTRIDISRYANTDGELTVEVRRYNELHNYSHILPDTSTRSHSFIFINFYSMSTFNNYILNYTHHIEVNC